MCYFFHLFFYIKFSQIKCIIKGGQDHLLYASTRAFLVPVNSTNPLLLPLKNAIVLARLL